ncbi:YbcC family protein [Caulobacter sp. KR2-114]|uniref:YbcC family protein n=1 Tax=Caulobacter sp. KR2-114 TaxID=3400912 RepID=UPI003C0B10A5
MSLAVSELPTDRAQPVQSLKPSWSKSARLKGAIKQACERIAPLWPLSSFVAVNPFLGFSGLPFASAVRELRRLTGARAVMPRDFYRQALQAGRIEPVDLAAALSEAPPGAGLTAERLIRALALDPPAASPVRRIATVADVLDKLAAGDRQVSRTAFMVDEISKWCAAYFDEGEAAWPAPWRDMPLYTAWRWSVRFDGNSRAMGVKGLADTVAGLAANPVEAIAEVLERLAIPVDQWTDYLYRALYDVRGWAAYVRRLDWEEERSGVAGGRLVDLLAIRVVWGYALYRQRKDTAFVFAWREAVASGEASQGALAAADDLAIDLALHRAYEIALQRRFFRMLSGGPEPRASFRPALQAVFCIDVRSETYRRALEAVWPEAETLGFAGFFGMPLNYGQGDEEAHAQCPVLLRPTVNLQAVLKPSGNLIKRSTTASSFLSQLKQSAVSCFGFVEAFGLSYGAKLALAAKGDAGAFAAPETPSLMSDGLDLARRAALAEGALKDMSLVEDFARLVLMVGHGSSTTNNAHKASLDCGACGGHSGAPNARFAAALLNEPAVRGELAQRGIRIPTDTWFVAGLHDTTTDTLWIMDRDQVPASHRIELAHALDHFGTASRLARAERAGLMGLQPGQEDAVLARSGDWSQVRPEWGLARAAAFIAAPRSITRGRDLEGRVFLHSYDRNADPGLEVLELILTAPLIVASWISLQYYGSTVDNAAFGAGDKTLHNVCGRVGVLEGNAGDLRPGLPLQSVHDGKHFVHEPVRLSAFIAAEPEAISEVLSRQPKVRELVDNGWLFLFTLDDAGHTTHRYTGSLSWEALA